MTEEQKEAAGNNGWRLHVIGEVDGWQITRMIYHRTAFLGLIYFTVTHYTSRRSFMIECHAYDKGKDLVKLIPGNLGIVVTIIPGDKTGDSPSQETLGRITAMVISNIPSIDQITEMRLP